MKKPLPRTMNERLAYIRKMLKLSQESLASQLTLSQSHVANMEKGKREIGMEIVKFLEEKYGVSMTWFIKGIGDPFSSKVAPNIAPYVAPITIEQNETTQNVQTKRDINNEEEAATKNQLIEQLVQNAEVEERFFPVPVDISGNELIPMTDIKAAAGGGYINQIEITDGNCISLPPYLLKDGKHLCVRIKGDSMSPTLQDSGFVIIRQLNRAEWKNLSDDRIYIVSDLEGSVYIKRLRNRFKKQGFIVLTSDNPDKASHPNFNLKEDEITSIWYVEWYFTAKMPNVHDNFYSKVSHLEEDVERLEENVKSIASEMEVLKKNIGGHKN